MMNKHTSALYGLHKPNEEEHLYIEKILISEFKRKSNIKIEKNMFIISAVIWLISIFGIFINKSPILFLSFSALCMIIGLMGCIKQRKNNEIEKKLQLLTNRLYMVTEGTLKKDNMIILSNGNILNKNIDIVTYPDKSNEKNNIFLICFYDSEKIIVISK